MVLKLIDGKTKVRFRKSNAKFIEAQGGALPADWHEVMRGAYRMQLARKADHLHEIDSSYAQSLKFSFRLAMGLNHIYIGADLKVNSKFMGCVFADHVIRLGAGRYATP